MKFARPIKKENVTAEGKGKKTERHVRRKGGRRKKEQRLPKEMR